MNASKIPSLKNILSLLILFATVLVACKEEEEEFPITNDLRVLQVNVGPDAIVDGVVDLSVLSELEFVFSHGLDATAFESALVVSPAVDYSITYDETGSFVTIAPETRLEYETTYTVGLPAGTYGASGEKTIADFSFTFSTKAFAPPKITLSSDVLSFFEGEVATITAKLDNIIFDAVTFDLVFSGTAIGPGTDYTTSATSLTIPAGSTEATFTITALEGDDIEGNESIIISLANVVNGSNEPPQQLTISLGDKAPSMELRGVMHLNTAAGTVRAIHLNVLKDIADLSIFHIQVASNGAAPDPLDLDFVFPANSATAGDQLFVVRDVDAGNAATYFGSCYASFTEFQNTAVGGTGITQNGDDAILLYEDGVSIESFGEPGVDGTGQFWEYTNSWAYKFGDEWYYAGINCTTGVATDEVSSCRYAFCSPGLEFRGIMEMNGSVGSVRAYHLFALQDIPDLSIFGFGIASNGAPSDGLEVSFPNQSVNAGDHILAVRESDLPNAVDYFGSCYNKFDHVLSIPGTTDGISSNGDDAIELFKNAVLIETYGVVGVDGTGEPWDYTDSWAYKMSGVWTYGGPDCTDGAASNAASTCPYTFCE